MAVAPRVVLDTNVVLSALVFVTGVTSSLRLRWQKGAFLPLVSTATVQELMRALAYPRFKLDAVAREELIADYLPFAEVVRIPDPAPATPACRDPFDLPFLQLAVAGKADVLVSGDRDLLVLSGTVSFAIVTPDGFATMSRAE